MDFSGGTFFDIKQITQHITQQVTQGIAEHAGELATHALTENQSESSGFKKVLVAGAAGFAATIFAIQGIKSSRALKQRKHPSQDPFDGSTPLPDETHPMIKEFTRLVESDTQALLAGEHDEEPTIHGHRLLETLADDPAIKDLATYYNNLYRSTYQSILDKQADINELFTLQQEITSFIAVINAAPDIPQEPADQEVVKECCICYEENIELRAVPCQRGHSELICQRCIDQISACPICRNVLIKPGQEENH